MLYLDGHCLSTVKDSAMIMGSFTQMLLKKLPSALDANPVKMVFSIVTIILSIKDVRQHSSH
jgi:hypothetical protein